MEWTFTDPLLLWSWAFRRIMAGSLHVHSVWLAIFISTGSGTNLNVMTLRTCNIHKHKLKILMWGNTITTTNNYQFILHVCLQFYSHILPLCFCRRRLLGCNSHCTCQGHQNYSKLCARICLNSADLAMPWLHLWFYVITSRLQIKNEPE